jgi:short-subunit dehydrogenase/acyl dehydratase/acyl carrier protein
MSPIDKQYSDFSVGDYVVFKRTYTEKDFETFSKLSGDTNPLHHDLSYAAKTKFDNTIVPLHLIASPLSAIAGTMIPGHRSLYLNTSIRGIAPVPYNKELTYSAKIIAKQDTNKVISLRVLVICGKTVYMEANINVQVRDDIALNSYAEEEKQPINNASHNRYALVTGAGGHIARAVVRRLIGDGWNIVLLYKSKNEAIEDLVKFAKNKGVKTHEVMADLLDQGHCEQMLESLKTLPQISALIHAASPSLESSVTDLINVNYHALTKIVDVLIPGMLCAQQGKIVLLGSSALQYHPVGWSNYIAAKAAATSYVEGVHKQFSAYGIQGRTLAPGYVQTPFSELYRDPDRISLLPGEVADEIADIVQDWKSNTTYTWMESGFRREGCYGFDEYVKKPSVLRGNKPSLLRDVGHLESKSSVEDLFLNFFKLTSEADLSQQRIGITPGWDSLSHIEFLLFLEESLSIHFSSAELDGTTQYVELEKLVNSKCL